MSNDFFEKIIKNAKGVKLSENEKVRLFRTVDYYVERNPISRKDPLTKKMPTRKVPTRSDISWWSYISYSRAVSFALIVFVVLGGGTSFAAESALPGDLLYSIKVGINEQVKAVLLTDIRRTNYEASLAVERLKETETLAERGQLDESKKAELETRFEAHAAKVQTDIRVFKERGEFKKALDANMRFETALKRHEQTLAVTSAESIAKRVKGSIETSVLVKKETEDSISSGDTNSNDVMEVAAEKKIAARGLIDNVSGKIAMISPRFETVEIALPPALPAPVRPTPAAPTTPIPGVTLVTPAPARPGSPIVSSGPALPGISGNQDLKVQTRMEQRKVISNEEKRATELLASAALLLAEGDRAMKSGKWNEAFKLYREAYEDAEEAQIIVDLSISDAGFDLYESFDVESSIDRS